MPLRHCYHLGQGFNGGAQANGRSRHELDQARSAAARHFLDVGAKRLRGLKGDTVHKVNRLNNKRGTNAENRRDMHKRASDLSETLEQASELLQHSSTSVTKRHYRTRLLKLKAVR